MASKDLICVYYARAQIDALNERARQQWRSDSRGALTLCEEAYRLA